MNPHQLGNRTRKKFSLILISTFLSVFTIGECVKRLAHKDQFLLYDANLPDYETVLTPSDFEMASEINDYPSQKNTIDGDDAWDSDAMYSPDKFEGDIANDLNASTVAMFIRGAPTDGDSNHAQYNAIRDRRQLWPNGRIPYALSSQYSSYSRSVIASAMQEYSKSTCIQWSPRGANDRDYIYIVPDRGCYSLVGRTGGRQTLSLGNGCIQKGIIIHEMMHAVGFFHEQSRTDRDDFITIMWHNILPGMQGQFEKYTTATVQTLGTEYDYGSIMHYGPNAFTRNGMPTIVPKRRASIGQRSGFSKIDSYKINTLYDCPNYNSGSGLGTVVGGAIAVPTARPAASLVAATTSQPSAVASTASTRWAPLPSSGLNGGVVSLCRNTRPDCEQLAKQGWCKRNSGWMRDNCPLACGLCSVTVGNSAAGIVPITTRPVLPDTLPLLPSNAGGSGGFCEDLRVDCAELAKRRYCITAQSFTRVYCARSCGFCFVPPVTEIPEVAAGNRNNSIYGGSVVNKAVTARPIENGKIPLVTFWPTLRPSATEAPPSTVSRLGESGTQSPSQCRDRKHFCVSWKKSGFCQGIFTNYMKKNCPMACGWC